MGVSNRVMKGFGVLVLVVAFWALPSKAMASPIACGGGVDVTTYSEGCFVDGLLFSEFSVINAGSSTVLVNAVLANVIDSTVFFNFNPGLTGDDLDDIHFYFKVSTLNGSAGIIGVDLENNGIGDTSIQESLCTVSWLVTFGCASNGGSLIGSGLLAFSGEYDNDFFNPVSSAYVFKDIAKDGTDEDAHLTSFTQSFHVVPDGGSTLALLGMGLLGLSSLRRRFARR
jgi:protein with PEP-CTERM/exosortase system signal